MKKEELSKLTKELPLQWRVKSAASHSAVCIPYIDARDQMKLLDEVCTPMDWRDEYTDLNGRLMCTLYIRIDGEWIGKQDAGKDSKEEGEKGGVSDAFKRAGVKWGINRQAYDTDPVITKTKEYNGKFFPVDDSGTFLKGAKLNTYCNQKSKKS